MNRKIGIACAVAPAAIVIALAGCSGEKSEGPPAIDPEVGERLSAWLEHEAEPPIAYVTGLFEEHDVVFLGEQHRIREYLLLVQDLMEPLHLAGVRVLGTEFARREDQPLIDSLIYAEDYDEELAGEIVFRQSVTWGYREYLDLFRVAWELNRMLPENSPRFRILGLNDSPDWSRLKSEADRDDHDIMKKVWRGGGEDRWAEVILESVGRGEKVLVHCGIHHAFTGYRQPVVLDGRFVRFGEKRCGNHVYDEIGGRAVTVFLHAPWNGPGGYGSAYVYPADGVIDALMLEIGPRPVGFDLAGGPFGGLRVDKAVYVHGYEDFRLADFCDGWIYLEPISGLEGVIPVDDWIDEENIGLVRRRHPVPSRREASIESLNRGIARSARIQRRWGHLR